MVPLGEQKQEEVAQTYKTSCRYVTDIQIYGIFTDLPTTILKIL